MNYVKLKSNLVEHACTRALRNLVGEQEAIWQEWVDLHLQKERDARLMAATRWLFAIPYEEPTRQEIEDRLTIGPFGFVEHSRYTKIFGNSRYTKISDTFDRLLHMARDGKWMMVDDKTYALITYWSFDWSEECLSDIAQELLPK